MKFLIIILFLFFTHNFCFGQSSVLIRAFAKYYKRVQGVESVAIRTAQNRNRVFADFINERDWNTAFKLIPDNEFNRIAKEFDLDFGSSNPFKYKPIENATNSEKISYYDFLLSNEINAKKIKEYTKAICDIRLNQISNYPTGIQSKHGKEFYSYRDVLEYETNMQIALKEMGFYKGQIDAHFGVNSYKALKKLKSFLELKPHQNINFQDNGLIIVVKDDKENFARISQRIADKRKNHWASEYCLYVDNQKRFTWAVGFGNVSLEIDFSNWNISLSGSTFYNGGGRTINISDKPLFGYAEHSANPDKGNTCYLEKICFKSTSLLSPTIKCKNNLNIGLGINSVNISANGKSIDF